VVERFAVLGLGAWGTALAHHLSFINSVRVVGWSRNQSLVDEIKTKRTNSKYFGNKVLSSSFLVTSSLKEAITDVEYILVALPSVALKEIMPEAVNLLCDKAIVISGVKGLCGSGKTALQHLESILPHQKHTLAALSGPCFASDLINQVPVSLVAASLDTQVATSIASIFSNSSMRVYQSNDTVGVELGGVLKNIIALAAGVSDGLGFGVSTRAALITRGLAEMTRFAVSLGAKRETLSGLSGLGDLVMTATSDQSRNRSFGLLIGQGNSVSNLRARQITVEAVNSLSQVIDLAVTQGVEMPIAVTLAKLLEGVVTPNQAVTYLVERPQKSEF
jgi:glycerol-3-phosphate dehydrogenase (NAD(P)+)